MAKGKFITITEKRKIMEIHFLNPSLAGNGIRSILQTNSYNTQRVPSIRSIQRVIGENLQHQAENQEWAIHIADDINLPNSHLAMLSRLSLVQEIEGYKLTNRDAKWASHIKSIAPDLADNDILSIATQYSFEELLGGKLDHKSMDNKDLMIGFLNKLLIYQPWISNQHRLEFIYAFKNKIPFPTQSITWSIWTYCVGVCPPKELNFEFDSPQQIPSLPPSPFKASDRWFKEMEMIWNVNFRK